jgi:methionyl-tRNA formyltransferase
VHASLLPKYRGAAPINHAIMNGDKETGLTAFLLKSTVDTGDIVVQERTAIGENETFGELYTRLSEASGRFLLKALDTVHTGGPFTRQDDSQATKAPKIFPADTFIQFTQSAEQVRNFVRGLSPFPGATTEFRGSQIKIVSCTHASIAQTEPKQPGMLDTQRNRLFVNCGDAPLEILQVKPSGKGTMDGSAFINGFQPRPEERFGAASPTLKESR